MSTGELIALLAGVAALIVAGIAWYRSGQPLTLAGVQEAYTSAQTLAAELSEVATTAVHATQQLKESGRITRDDEALQHALGHVTAWFPTLDRGILIDAIEAAYFGYKLTIGSTKAQIAAAAVKPPASEQELIERFRIDDDTGAEIPLG